MARPYRESDPIMGLPTLHAVPFHGDSLATFEHENERWVALRPAVEALGLDWASQTVKLAKDGDRFNCCDITTVGADGRQRQMLSIPLRRFPGWLATINPNKIPDEVKRAKVVLYQDRSYDALYDFWFKGVAVRDNMDGIVTGVDPQVMRSLGGMVKGIVNKALTETVAVMVEAELLKRHGGHVPGWTAGDVVHEVVADMKGLRGLPQMVSRHLDSYHKDKGATVKRGYLGSNKACLFDEETCRQWLKEKGRALIERYVQMRRGQDVLPFIIKGKKKGAA